MVLVCGCLWLHGLCCSLWLSSCLRWLFEVVVVNSVGVLHSFVLNNALLCFVFWLLFVLCVVWFGFGGLFNVLCDFALLFVFGVCLCLGC